MVNAKKITSQAESAILQSARKEFERHGLAGARMQRIADEAGINKALLHYYFRNKNQLFLRIFEEAISQTIPQLQKIIHNEGGFPEKIQSFVHLYISTLNQHPYLPAFVLSELRHQPVGFFKKNFPAHTLKAIQQMFVMLDKAASAGIIRKWDWEQLLISMISLCVFPFAATPIIQHLLSLKEQEMKKFMEDRKVFVTQFLLAALKPDHL